VLIVDDDPGVRRLWQRSLELANFKVVVACDGAEGLQQLRADPAIDLVLLDLVMPELDGWEFLRRQQADQRLAGIPVVVITGSTLPPDREPSAAGCLRKPVSQEHLLRVVARYCTPNRRLTPAGP
jgi:CheY-like chemotaxis protein